MGAQLAGRKPNSASESLLRSMGFMPDYRGGFAAANKNVPTSRGVIDLLCDDLDAAGAE